MEGGCDAVSGFVARRAVMYRTSWSLVRQVGRSFLKLPAASVEHDKLRQLHCVAGARDCGASFRARAHHIIIALATNICVWTVIAYTMSSNAELATELEAVKEALAPQPDVTQHVLAPFGGAGPQFACSVARSLGMSRCSEYLLLAA